MVTEIKNKMINMQKLKICYISLTTYPDAMDGSAKFVRKVFDELKNRGHNITLLTAKWNEGFTDPNIIAINVPSLRFLWLPKFAIAFRRYLKRNNFDIIHSNGSRPSIPIILSGKPYISTIHDIGPFQTSFTKFPIVKLIEKQNAKASKYIVTCSESTKNEVSKYMKVPLDKINMVSSFIDSKFKPSLQQGSVIKESLKIKGPIIYYVGRIAFYKGIEDIIRAYYIAKKEIQDLNLVIAGKPEIKMQSEYENWKKIYPEVKFIGTISDDEMSAYYSMADIFTTYSFASEGFGLTPVEALACGTPVICSNLPAYKEVLNEYATFIDPKQPELLAKAYINQIRNPDIGKQQVKSATEFLKKYTLKNVVDNIELLYQKYMDKYNNKKDFPLNNNFVCKCGENLNIQKAKNGQFYVKCTNCGYYLLFKIEKMKSVVLRTTNWRDQSDRYYIYLKNKQIE